MSASAIDTDVVIIGAGPCGLFQIFELGLLGIKAHVVEALDQPGGQCAELYPDKPIYDIPALPVIGAQQLIDNLVQQAQPFAPSYHFGQRVEKVERAADGRWHLLTDKGLEFYTKAVIVAGGVGAFEPVRLKIPGVPQRDGSSVFYSVKDLESHRGKDVVVLGGGDSALDWALSLQPIANSVLLVHRSEHFKAAPASVERMRALCDELEMQFLTGNVTGLDGGSDDASKSDLIGDINWYPGKKKLILSGFHEAALAAFAIKEQLNPGKKASLQYTTTSSLMHERLGVDNPFTDDEMAA